MNTDGLVAPFRHTQIDVDTVKVMAELGQPVATPAHGYPSSTQPPLDLDQLGLEMLQPTLLGVSLGLGCVTVDSTPFAPNGGCEPRANGTNRAAQSNSVVDKASQRPRPLIIGCASDRSRPTA